MSAMSARTLMAEREQAQTKLKETPCKGIILIKEPDVVGYVTSMTDGSLSFIVIHEDTESHLAVDFVECHPDSANFKQVWYALAALAIL